MTMFDALTDEQETFVAPPVGVRRLLATGDPSLRTHLATFGPLPSVDGLGGVDGVTAALEEAGLAGRGGAAFPPGARSRRRPSPVEPPSSSRTGRRVSR